MRQEQDYCNRCGNPIEADMLGKTNICGTCADTLRDEEVAILAQHQDEAYAQREAEDRARAEEIELIEQEQKYRQGGGE